MGTKGKLACSHRDGYSYENYTYFSMQMQNLNQSVFGVKSPETYFMSLKF